MKNLKIIGYSLLIIIVSIISELIGKVAGDVSAKLSFLLGQIIMLIVSILIFYGGYQLLAHKVFQQRFDWISLRPRIKWQYFIPAILMFAFIFIGYIATGIQLISTPVSSSGLWSNLISTVLLGGITGPFIEEITFRGVVLQLFSKRYGYVVGILIQGFIFGAMHLMNGVGSISDGILLVLSGGIAGILFGVIAYLNHSIWASFSIHLVFNVFSTFVPISMSNPGGWPFFFKIDSMNKLLTGGAPGIQASLISMISYILVAIILIYWFKKRSNVFNNYGKDN